MYTSCQAPVYYYNKTTSIKLITAFLSLATMQLKQKCSPRNKIHQDIVYGYVI